MFTTFQARLYRPDRIKLNSAVCVRRALPFHFGPARTHIAAETHFLSGPPIALKPLSQFAPSKSGTAT